jgi:hypothetical protein
MGHKDDAQTLYGNLLSCNMGNRQEMLWLEAIEKFFRMSILVDFDPLKDAHSASNQFVLAKFNGNLHHVVVFYNGLLIEPSLDKALEISTANLQAICDKSFQGFIWARLFKAKLPKYDGWLPSLSQEDELAAANPEQPSDAKAMESSPIVMRYMLKDELQHQSNRTCAQSSRTCAMSSFATFRGGCNADEVFKKLSEVKDEIEGLKAICEAVDPKRCHSRWPPSKVEGFIGAPEEFVEEDLFLLIRLKILINHETTVRFVVVSQGIIFDPALKYALKLTKKNLDKISGPPGCKER